MRRILLGFFNEADSSLKLVEGFNAPLGTFSTRTAAAYSLGLISNEEFKECETLRRIRNRFAHDVHTSFDTQDIRDLCKNLTKAAKSYGDVTVDARGQYTTAAVALILQLTNRPAYVSRKRRNIEDWPN
ncbi:MAG: transcriptional regulator [Methylocystis sp.]